MNDVPDEKEGGQPPYSGGVPDFERFGFIPLHTALARPMPQTEETLKAVAQILGRPVRYVDDNGYDHEITAAALHPTHNWCAWVEYKCKELKNGFVDVEFRLKAHADGKQRIDWTVETYNPYFGCVVQYMSWHDEWVVIVYQEKHHTYACSLGLGGSNTRIRIADEWLVANEELMYTSDTPDYVSRLNLPDLKKLDHLSSIEARQRGVLPDGYDEANELNKRIEATKKARRPRGFWGVLNRVLRWPQK